MNSFRKDRPLRLDHKAYDQLRRQVLERDGWRCQYCGRRDQLEVHHAQYRSHQGDDSEDNLITLCRGCHSKAHTRSTETYIVVPASSKAGNIGPL